MGLALSGIGAWIMGATGNIGGLAMGRAITGLAAEAWLVAGQTKTAVMQYDRR